MQLSRRSSFGTVLYILGLLLVSCADAGAPSGAANPGGAVGKTTGECSDDNIPACDARCKSGDGHVCMILGNYRMLGKIPGDAREAFELGCQFKNVTSCENLGTVLVTSPTSTPTDKTRAFQLQQDACDGGSFNACYNLANYHLGGIGTRPDPARAAALLQSRICGTKVNDFDDMIIATKGCKILGELYATGTGVEQDLHRALKLLKLACEVGTSTAKEFKEKGVQVEWNGFNYLKACNDAQRLESEGVQE